MGGNGWVSWDFRRGRNRLPLVVTPHIQRRIFAENGGEPRVLHYGTVRQLSICGASPCHADLLLSDTHIATCVGITSSV